jgi:hypothetical protein
LAPEKIGFANAGAGLRPILSLVIIATGLAPNGRTLAENGKNGSFLSLDGAMGVTQVLQGFTTG